MSPWLILFELLSREKKQKSSLLPKFRHETTTKHVLIIPKEFQRRCCCCFRSILTKTNKKNVFYWALLWCSLFFCVIFLPLHTFPLLIRLHPLNSKSDTSSQACLVINLTLCTQQEIKNWSPSVEGMMVLKWSRGCKMAVSHFALSTWALCCGPSSSSVTLFMICPELLHRYSPTTTCKNPKCVLTDCK